MKTRELAARERSRPTGPGAATTCWTMVRAASDGERSSRDAFAWRYEPVVRMYLASRWETSCHKHDIDDAIQEVFLECFRDGGALARASEDGRGRFRTFLFAVTRNVARRVEERTTRLRARFGEQDVHTLEIVSDEHPPSHVFDRTWAQHLVQQARDLLESRAARCGGREARRALLLALRFNEGRPIRDIAREWNVDAAYLHHEYATARAEFASALREVVAFHQPSALGDVDAECLRIRSLLGS